MTGMGNILAGLRKAYNSKTWQPSQTHVGPLDTMIAKRFSTAALEGLAMTRRHPVNDAMVLN